MEGAWFSQSAIDRSRIRLQRLTYFERVEIETPAVPGTDDQVDIIVNVEERPAGSFSVGLGYSEIQGLIYSMSIQQDNFLGSGKRVGAAVSSSDIISNVNFSYENPYWTEDGVSRGFYARYSEFDRQAANISTFTSSEAAAGINFGAPGDRRDDRGLLWLEYPADAGPSPPISIRYTRHGGNTMMNRVTACLRATTVSCWRPQPTS